MGKLFLHKGKNVFCFNPYKRTFVHYVLPAMLSLFGLLVSLVEVYDFRPNVWNFGLFINVMWNFASGNGWLMSFYEGIRPVNFLSDHFDLLSPLFSWLLKIFPSPYTYASLHAASFAAVFFIVPIFVKEIYHENGSQDYLKPATFLLIALCLFPGIIGAWRYQSHPTTLAMPFLLLALLLLHRDKVGWCIVCCVLVAMAQERAVPAVFGVGMYAILLLKKYRLGIWLCVCSASYFILLVKFAIPWFADSQYSYSGNIMPLYDLDRKILFLLKCIAGWFFLLCLGKKAVLASICALPILGIGLVSNREGMYTFGHQYHDLPSMFLFVGAAYGVFKVTSCEMFRRIPKMAVYFVVCVCFSVSVLCFYWFNPVYRLFTRENLSAIHELNTILKKYNNLPQDLNIYVSTGIGSRFALHERVYHIMPKNADKDMKKSMIFIAPNFDMYPYDKQKTEEILDKLEMNKSIYQVMKNELICIYASKDIPSNEFE